MLWLQECHTKFAKLTGKKKTKRSHSYEIFGKKKDSVTAKKMFTYEFQFLKPIIRFYSCIFANDHSVNILASSMIRAESHNNAQA